MKILITGAAGFIGSNLARYFIKAGHEVVGVDNLITGSERNLEEISTHNAFTFMKNDVIETSYLQGLKDKEFDSIYHLASPASPKQYLAYPTQTLLVNSLGTYNLLEFIKHAEKKPILIYTSTSEVYGDPHEHPQKETYWGNVNPIGIRSCYDEGKRFGEALCMTYVRQHNLDVRIVRLFNTYGPGMEKDDGRVVSNFIMQALEKKPITVYGDGSQTRSFCYVSDMIEALHKISETDMKGEVINLGNDDEQKILDIAHLVRKLTKSNSEIVMKPLPDDDPKRRKPDLTKVRTHTNWSPKISLSDGLLKTIAYFSARFNV